MTKQRAYEARYILANGAPRTFTVWAFNKSDASSEAFRRLIELDGFEQARAARAWGIERRAW